jgi:UDP-3-O-[3-hydroxymyristoyl] N-acetylglucosamine deacetylase
LQNTVKKEFQLSGVSLHSGETVCLKVRPAPANSGIKFKRVDVANKDPIISAVYNFVSNTKLCTTISNSEGISVKTIEHLMAALAGTGIHNAVIELDGPELPILDGSSREFVKNILSVGKHVLDVPLTGFKILKEILVCEGNAWAKLVPADALSIDFKIDYSDTIIGQQNLFLPMSNGTFVRELCDNRTFCRESEIAHLRSQGLAKGGSLENAIILEPKRIKNVEGLRREDECVRHKMLDAMGDLSLAGGPVLAAFSSNCGGHTLTNKLLRAAFSDTDAIAHTKIIDNEARQLPGFDLCESDLCNLS